MGVPSSPPELAPGIAHLDEVLQAVDQEVGGRSDEPREADDPVDGGLDHQTPAPSPTSITVPLVAGGWWSRTSIAAGSVAGVLPRSATTPRSASHSRPWSVK